MLLFRRSWMLLFRRANVSSEFSAAAGWWKLGFRGLVSGIPLAVFVFTSFSSFSSFSSAMPLLTSSSSFSLSHASYVSLFLLNVSMKSSTNFLVLNDLADLANIAPHVGSFAADIIAPVPSSKSSINLENSSKSIVPFPSASISLNAFRAIVADSSRSPAIIFHAEANSSNSTSPPPSESSAANNSRNCVLFASVNVRFTTFFLFASHSRVCWLTHREEGDGVVVVHVFFCFSLRKRVVFLPPGVLPRSYRSTPPKAAQLCSWTSIAFATTMPRLLEDVCTQRRVVVVMLPPTGERRRM